MVQNGIAHCGGNLRLKKLKNALPPILLRLRGGTCCLFIVPDITVWGSGFVGCVPPPSATATATTASAPLFFSLKQLIFLSSSCPRNLSHTQVISHIPPHTTHLTHHSSRNSPHTIHLTRPISQHSSHKTSSHFPISQPLISAAPL